MGITANTTERANPADWPVLLVHNRYLNPGGEERSVDGEVSLLEAHGHRVVRFEETNRNAVEMNPVALGIRTVWNSSAAGRVADIIARDRPRIAHFHNTFPLISPAAYYAVRRAGVPIVQTLHNFRLACVNGLFFRGGRVCEDCLGHPLPWLGVLRRCYRDSFAASATVASMLGLHRLIGTWRECVDLYIAPSEFAREKFVAAGLPPDKIVVKTNFLGADPSMGREGGGHALFVGRLGEEKGLRTLIEAWRMLSRPVELRIVGDGPLAPWIRLQAASMENVSILGEVPHRQALLEMKSAGMLVFPSLCFETAGRVIQEAFATGLPVIASNHGPMIASVRHGETGLRFTPGDPADLARQVEWVIARPDRLRAMREAARAEFDAHYSQEINYRSLISIYETAHLRRSRAK